MLRVIVRNVVSNWIGYAVQVGVVFFLTPFVVSTLGDSRYGIWALVTGLTGYYGMLDLGFRSGITQYLTRHLAVNEFEKMNRAASTAFATMAAFGGTILVLSLFMSWAAPHLFSISTETTREARLCIVVVGISTAIQFACFPFSAVFAATQRYDMANAIGIGTRLTAAGMTFVALKLGYGLVGLSVVNASAEILGYAVRCPVAFRILPQLKISGRMVGRESFFALSSFGISSFAVQSALQLRAYSSSMIIGICLPVAALTPFALATGLVSYFGEIFGSFATVFFPVATQFDATGDRVALRRMYLVGSKLLLLLGLGAGLMTGIWAKDFYRLWVGARFVEKGVYPPVQILFLILLMGAIAEIGQKIGMQVFLGSRWLRPLGILVVSETLCNLVLSISLVWSFGLLGMGLAYSLPVIVFQGVMHPIVLCRRLEIPFRAYLRRVWVRPALVTVILAPAFLLIRQWVEPAANWGMLVIAGVLAASFALPVMVAVGLEKEERSQFFLRPLGNLYSRFSPTRARTAADPRG